MKKILNIIFLLLFVITSGSVFAIENSEKIDIVIPEEMSWTQRFIISEQKELRTDLEKLRREIVVEIQKKELKSIDRALSYSENTLNFFFIFLSIILAGIGLLGWRTISDAKKSIKESMERRVDRVLVNFKDKIKSLEDAQEKNILWRNFYAIDSSSEKLELLKKLEDISPTEAIMIEKTNVYLDLEVYDEVIKLSNKILKDNRENTTVLYNRAYAYSAIGKKELSENDIKLLLQISPDYAEIVEKEDIFKA